MFNRKAQAAMEFLMTYGWAILVVLVAIGALAYFGVLSPDKFLPEQTNGPSGMDAIDKAAVTSTTVGVGIKNNLGFDINLTKAQTVTLKTDDSTAATICGGGATAATLSVTVVGGSSITNLITASSDITVKNGDSFNVIYTCPSGTGATTIGRGRFKGVLTFNYVNLQTGLSHPASYSITARVA